MNDSKAIARNMLFNTVGSVLYYVCQWLMTVIIVHTSGYEKAGVLSLAMSVAAAPSIVALFNVRSYQVSDVDGAYSDRTYIRSRIYTSLFAYVICIGMTLAGGYTLEKASAILLFMVFKIAEAVADVYYGMEQKYGRLDYAGISLSVRGLGSLALFTVLIHLTDNLSLSIVAMSVFSFLVIFAGDRRFVRRYGVNGERAEGHVEVKALLLTCIPLAVVAFLNNYSFNIAKIMLERYFGAEVMGYYSSVSSPTLVVQLAATTMFAPLVSPLAQAFAGGDKDTFYRIIRKFAVLFGALAVVCLIGSRLLAEWGLVLLFGESIQPYVYMFIPIIVTTIFVAVNACLFSVCTLIREIKSQYIIGIGGMLVAIILSFTVVKRYSMMGVVYTQTGTILLQIVIQLVIIFRKLKKTWQT